MAHSHHHSDSEFDWAAMVEFAELDAEVLISLLDEATSLLADLCASDGLEVRRILDIGSGPGVGTCVLAERFPAATVIAADGTKEMLVNVEARAARLGLSERVETSLVDLPDGLGGLGQADLVWASLVLHHVGDEAAALRGLRARLRPGGLLALAEFGARPRFVPEDADLGRPGLWDRLDTASSDWLAGMRASLPGAVPSADYPTMIQAAGFELLIDRELTVRLDPPLDDRARRDAYIHVQRMREHVNPYAEPADLEALDVLLDEQSPSGILNRPDAILHASRHLYVARAI